MTQICKNCQYEIELNFCANCGQKKMKRIDRIYLKDELQYTLLHTNKGFLYSAKMLIKDPGRTTAEFIDGNRVNHYKPILMVFVLAGLHVLLTSFLPMKEIMTNYYVDSNAAEYRYNMFLYDKMMKYNSFIMVGIIPVAALCSWIAFKKWGHNFYEHVIINANLLSAMMIVSILVIFPIQLILVPFPMLFVFIPVLLTFGIMICFTFWMFVNIYSQQSPGDVILRVLLFFTVFGIVLLLMSVAGLSYLIANGAFPGK